MKYLARDYTIKLKNMKKILNKNTQEKINKKRWGNEKIRDARIDHYELIEMESAFRRNLITYEFNGDENKTLSLNEYL